MARDPSTYRAARKKVAREAKVPWRAARTKMYGKKNTRGIEKPAQMTGKYLPHTGGDGFNQSLLWTRAYLTAWAEKPK